MYCEYEGDVLHQSVRSHLDKRVSSGSAQLSMCTLHSNVIYESTALGLAVLRCAIVNTRMVGGYKILRATKE